MSRHPPQRASSAGGGPDRAGVPPAVRTAAAALLGLVFLLGLGTEALALRSCPHHHPDREGAPPPAPVASVDQPPSGSPADRSAPPRCMCVGSCTTATSAPLPAVDALPRVAIQSPPRRGAPARDDRVPSAPSPYLLPYPNGPPPALG